MSDAPIETQDITRPPKEILEKLKYLESATA